MTILVLGFYNRYNLGDDLFQTALQNIIQKPMIFANPDDLDTIPNEIEIILVGGGDLVNDYFIKKIRLLVKDLRLPVYGIGLGFPYQDLITKEYLDIFDVIITRTKSAYPKLLKIMPGRVFLQPDLVYTLKVPPRIKNPKIIGIFFANSIGKQHVDKLVEIVEGVARMKSKTCGGKEYHVRLYSMNTSGNVDEDDSILNRAIFNKCTSPNIKIMDEIKIEDFKNFYATICTRYHAHILSLMAGVPFVSLYSTEKVRDLLETEGLLKYGVEMEVDIKLRPINFNPKEVLNKLKSLTQKFKGYDTKELQWGIKNLLFYKPRYGEKLTKSTMYSIKKYPNENKDNFSKAITFSISRKLEDDFTWGLRQNMDKPDFCLEEAVKWILENKYKSFDDFYTSIPFEQRIYNFRYFDNSLREGIHRSGWQYVINNIMKYHNPNGIIFDNFLDQTFGWNRDILTEMGILPFKNPWVGIFHHTFNDSYSENNMKNVVNSSVFKKSLKKCKGLIVLSEYLATLLKPHVGDIPINVLYHPTEFTNKKWIGWGVQTKYPSLVQIGAWLRDPYGIYTLNYPNKYVLKGMEMENYFPQKEFCDKLFDFFIPNECKNSLSRVRQKANKFIVGMVDSVKEKVESVKVIEYLNNDGYDDLLTSCIVFLKLIDASACNTIIECIVRNTPILVNKIPAVVEYLGKDYPLYYETLEEADKILKNLKLIKKASQYLSKKDKTFLKIETFLEGINKCAELHKESFL